MRRNRVRTRVCSFWRQDGAAIIIAAALLVGLAPAANVAKTASASPALSTGLAFPARVTVDPVGNLFISDTFNHTVRRLDAAGNITTIAGTGNAGYGGDGGPATTAQLDFPMGLAFDPEGDLFIADEGNDRVRKVDPSGTITTVAGDGTGGAALGEVAADGDEGPATAARINRPYGVAFANGVLYIADTQHNRIRAVTSDAIIHAFAGTGAIALPPASNGDNGPATEASMLFPTAVAADDAGNVYFPEFLFNRVRHVDPSGTITTFAGDVRPGATGDGGPASSARLAQPYDVAVDTDGNLLIADSGNHSVRRVETAAADAVITTVAAHGSALYIADEGNNRIRMVAEDGAITTIAGTGVPAVQPPALAAPDSQGAPALKHVWEIVLENEESSKIYDSPAAPYLNSLIARSVKLDAMYGTGHASLDNYLAMFGGYEPNPNTELDCSVAAPGCTIPADPTDLPTNLGDQLEAAGLTWKVYAESMPAPCTYSPTAPTTYSTPFAERHTPALFFHSIIDDTARCQAHVVPYEDPAVGLMGDLASEQTAPSFSLIVPNAINDGHDGSPPDSIANADNWLAANLPAILDSPAYKDGGMVIVSFDEGTSTQGCCGADPGGGKIATLVLSPLAKTDVVSSRPYNHYSVLRTIEDAFGLSLLNHAGDLTVRPFGDDVWR